MAPVPTVPVEAPKTEETAPSPAVTETKTEEVKKPEETPAPVAATEQK